MAINTTKIGNVLEDKVYGIISELVATNEFIVNSKYSKCYQKREYYSESRKKNIVTDVSIETFLPSSDKYSSLIIIECKNYPNDNVGIEDIEEFDSKLHQIGEHNSKGIMVSSKGFGSTVITFAESKGIGLIKIGSKNTLDWVVYRKDKKNSSNEKVFEGFFKNEIFGNLGELLVALCILDKYYPKTKFINFPYKSIEEIRTIVSKAKNEIYKNDLLDVDLLVGYLKGKYNLEFNFDAELGDENGKNITLGMFQTSPLKISIDKKGVENMQRWRFTLAHEVGHFILHGKMLSEFNIQINDTDESLGLMENIDHKSMERIEIQANIFAKEILMPYESLMEVVRQYFKTERIFNNQLYLDDQPVNKALVYSLLRIISTTYNVSIQVAKNHLIDLGLIKDVQIHFNDYLKIR